MHAYSKKVNKVPKYMQSNSMVREANTQINHIFINTDRIS